jgi:hypothetical protein
MDQPAKPSTIMDPRSSAKWTAPALRRFQVFIEQADAFLRMTQSSMNVLTAIPRIVEAVEKAEPARTEEARARALATREKAAREAQFAREQQERGFPTLYAHTIVALWGALEVMTKDLVIAWLQHVPDALSAPAFASIRITLVDYDRLDQLDRLHYLVRELERSLKSDLKAGVNRFETLLDAIGMSGEVPDEARRLLFEMSQVRNVIVHSGSIADRKFVDACPWLGFKIGDEVRVTDARYKSYFVAVTNYMITVCNRALVHAGIERAELADFGLAGKVGQGEAGVQPL